MAAGAGSAELTSNRPARRTTLTTEADQAEAGYRPGAPIVLVPYDTGWSSNFARESAEVAAALGDVLVGIHHIGSTAIPDSIAKPIIDILALVTDLALHAFGVESSEAQRHVAFPRAKVR